MARRVLRDLPRRSATEQDFPADLNQNAKLDLVPYFGEREDWRNGAAFFIRAEDQCLAGHWLRIAFDLEEALILDEHPLIVDIGAITVVRESDTVKPLTIDQLVDRFVVPVIIDFGDSTFDGVDEVGAHVTIPFTLRSVVRGYVTKESEKSMKKGARNGRLYAVT